MGTKLIVTVVSESMEKMARFFLMLPPPWISKEKKKREIPFLCLPLYRHRQPHFWKVQDAGFWSGGTAEEHSSLAPALGYKSPVVLLEDFSSLAEPLAGDLVVPSPLL